MNCFYISCEKFAKAIFNSAFHEDLFFRPSVLTRCRHRCFRFVVLFGDGLSPRFTVGEAATTRWGRKRVYPRTMVRGGKSGENQRRYVKSRRSATRPSTSYYESSGRNKKFSQSSAMNLSRDNCSARRCAPFEGHVIIARQWIGFGGTQRPIRSIETGNGA